MGKCKCVDKLIEVAEMRKEVLKFNFPPEVGDFEEVNVFPYLFCFFYVFIILFYLFSLFFLYYFFNYYLFSFGMF